MQTDRQTNSQMRDADKETDKLTDGGCRQTDRQTDTQTNSQTERQILASLLSLDFDALSSGPDDDEGQLGSISPSLLTWVNNKVNSLTWLSENLQQKLRKHYPTD